MSSLGAPPAEFMSIGRNLSRLAAEKPDAPALTIEGKTLSFGELHARTNRMARGLLQQGVKQGDFVTIALPRVKDFRGLNPKSFDGRGNFSCGLKEHIVFPEIDYDKVDQIWGMDVIVCTSAHTDDEARELLRAFNFPFRS